MRLSDYQWSRNPRGLHNRNAYTPLDVSRYTRMRLGWAKIVCGGAEFTDQARALLSAARASNGPHADRQLPEQAYHARHADPARPCAHYDLVPRRA